MSAISSTGRATRARGRPSRAPGSPADAVRSLSVARLLYAMRRSQGVRGHAALTGLLLRMNAGALVPATPEWDHLMDHLAGSRLQRPVLNAPLEAMLRQPTLDEAHLLRVAATRWPSLERAIASHPAATPMVWRELLRTATPCPGVLAWFAGSPRAIDDPTVRRAIVASAPTDRAHVALARREQSLGVPAALEHLRDASAMRVPALLALLLRDAGPEVAAAIPPAWWIGWLADGDASLRLAAQCALGRACAIAISISAATP
jgi:hypothetical protein